MSFESGVVLLHEVSFLQLSAVFTWFFSCENRLSESSCRSSG